jgi:hypothetical protein
MEILALILGAGIVGLWFRVRREGRADRQLEKR